MSAAVVSVITSGVLGVTAIAFGVLNSSKDRQHTFQLAREERSQARRGDAYVDLLELALLMGDYCADLQRFVEQNPPQPRTPIASREFQARTYAKVDAYGSPDVRKSVKAWQGAVDQILKADRLINLANAARRDGDASPELTKAGANNTLALLSTLLPAEDAARAALRIVVSRELTNAQT